MKICEKCGHRNLNVKLNSKKKRVCDECNTLMSDKPQCTPVLGAHDYWGDGYTRQKIPDSDDL